MIRLLISLEGVICGGNELGKGDWVFKCRVLYYRFLRLKIEISIKYGKRMVFRESEDY